MWSTKLRHVCGQLESTHDYQRLQYQWTIKPLTGFTTQLIFHKFRLLYSSHCNVNHLRIRRDSLRCQHQEVYCGHQPPWLETAYSAAIEIQLSLNHIQSVTEFIIGYFTRKKPLFTLRIVTHILQNNKDIYSGIHTKISQMLWLSFNIFTKHVNIMRILLNDSGKTTN